MGICSFSFSCFFFLSWIVFHEEVIFIQSRNVTNITILLTRRKCCNVDLKQNMIIPPFCADTYIMQMIQLEIVSSTNFTK